MAAKKLPSTGDRPQNSPTATGLPAGECAGGAADSAGFPWAGRTFMHHDTAFADDNGLTPPQLQQAVNRLREAAEAYRQASSGQEMQQLEMSFSELAAAQQAVLAAVSQVRLLVPLVAAAGEIGYTPEGKKVEKTQELSIITVSSADGRAVLPVFSSVEAMLQWDPQARPIPVPGPQAVLAAAQENTPLIIVDPGQTESEVGIRSTQFEQAVTGQVVLPVWADENVQEQVQKALASQTEIKTAQLLPADPEMRLQSQEIDLVLALQPGLDTQELQKTLARAGDLLYSVEYLAQRIDSLCIKPVAADWKE
ncbi:MAG: SseB family protein [Microbacteriaceae bacterium]|nr:SseB family protein [Microbacteriaceae bacterium]